VSASPAGQTIVADPARTVASEQCCLEVARPFPTRAQPSPPQAGDGTHLEPPDNATRPAVRGPRPTSLVIDSPFAAVPEWVIDAQISDTALRLYCVLLRYGNTTGHRMPSRATLAARLHKKSTDTIDRALKELEDLGALAVEHRATGTGRALTNRYHLLTASPGASRAIPHAGAAPLRPLPTRGNCRHQRQRRASDTAIAAEVRPLPAARVRPGWPQESGRTESHLPRHHPTPSPPPHPLRRSRCRSTATRPARPQTRRPSCSTPAGSPTSAPSSANSTTTAAASPAL